jgi:hypothetical protein
MVNHGRGGNRAEGGRKGLERQAAFNKRVPLAFYRGGLPALPPDSPPAISLRWRETMGWCGGLAGWLARKRSRILPPCVRFFLIIFFCSRSVFRGHRAAHDFGTAPEKTRLRTRIDSRLEIGRSSCTGVLLSVTGSRVRWCGAHALPRYEIVPRSGRLTFLAKNPNEAEHRHVTRQ